MRPGLALIADRCDSGYDVARMRYEITLAPEAVEDLRNLKANVRAAVREPIEQHLRHEPAKTSRSRIKRLRGLSRPQYRLRAEDVRIYYDVAGERVEILAIVSKAEADAWLRQQGEIDETDSTL
jgi:mRNA interferase RelE/StbE